MADAGIVTRRRAGLHSYYAVSDTAVYELCGQVCGQPARSPTPARPACAKPPETPVPGTNVSAEPPGPGPRRLPPTSVKSLDQVTGFSFVKRVDQVLTSTA